MIRKLFSNHIRKAGAAYFGCLKAWNNFFRLILVFCILCGWLSQSGCAPLIEDTTRREYHLRPLETISYPPEPTVVRLILVLAEEEVRLLSATPKRGNIERPALDKKMEDIFEGKVIVLEYKAQNSRSEVLAAGLIPVMKQIRIEYLDAEERHIIRRQDDEETKPIFKVNVLYDPDLSEIEFNQLLPQVSVPVQKWKRVSRGRLKIDPKELEALLPVQP